MLGAVGVSAHAQYYPQGSYPPNQYPYWTENPAAAPQAQDQWQQPDRAVPPANLQYDRRDAERILRDQVARTQAQPYSASQAALPQVYGDYYGHRIQDEGRLSQVMAEARGIAQLITKKNGKAFIVIDKRNFQFYLYDRTGRLLRIGPVAVGKGQTRHGAFETPVGIFPIKTKEPVADWIRPDWYFREEGEPIPQRWEDRRVPGFFRYKLKVDGQRYIHYAEATGGRLTHGCLGLDWEDAEAVFHTLQVGSYCIVIDGPFLTRLAKGEFLVKKPQVVASTTAASSQASNGNVVAKSDDSRTQERVFESLW